MLKIVIPMAGKGSRFSEARYCTPKPFIDVLGMKMIELVIKNLTPSIEHQFIFICQIEHDKNYGISSFLKSINPKCEVKLINGLTEGAACTVLEAQEYITNDMLMIANCDQYIETNINDYLSAWSQSQMQGYIMTMNANDKKWSYIKINANGKVSQVVEKKVISNEATVGIYNFSSGLDFVNAAKKMISKKKKVNNEYYVAPVFNILINDDYSVGYYNIGEVNHGMYGLGTPEDLDAFIKIKSTKK
jgi:dTDP-glucose pyrophosphorylase